MRMHAYTVNSSLNMSVAANNAFMEWVRLIGRGKAGCRAFSRGLHWLKLLTCTSAVALQCASSLAQPVLQNISVLEVKRGIQSMAWHPDGQRLAVGYFLQDEVEVWDVQTKKPLFSVPSSRRPHVPSGQEVVFSPDGKYLVVVDVKDTQNGSPPVPRTEDDPQELPARANKDRFILARVWDVEQRREISQLKGPGAWLYGGLGGICWLSTPSPALAMLRESVVFTYVIPSGRRVAETNALRPFSKLPDRAYGYWKMACHPSEPLVALEGQRFSPQTAPLMGYSPNSGATAVVVADVKQQRIVKTLISPTPLNGVVYTADGSKLVSFGAPPIRVWDAVHDYATLGEIGEPHANTNYFAALPGFDGVVGLSGNLHIWNTQNLQRVSTVAVPPDVFRIAVHQTSRTVAVAIGRFAHLYRFNPDALKPSGGGN